MAQLSLLTNYFCFSRLTVQKEGPNKGRHFYGCPKPREQGCGFFQWADEDTGEWMSRDIKPRSKIFGKVFESIVWWAEICSELSGSITTRIS